MPKYLLLNLSIFLFLCISIIPGIFAPPVCFEEIQNNWPDGAVVNGQYRIRVSPQEGPVVAEIIQGGYFDTRNFCLNVFRDPVEFFGEINVRTAPLHIICYDASDPSIGGSTTPGISSENGCWQKGRTLQTFSLFIDSEKQGIEDSIQSVGSAIGSTPLLNSIFPTTYNMTLNSTISKSYDNYRTTDDPIVLGIAWFYLVLGLFLIFRFSLKIGER